jgi:hypothetical protein
VTNPQQIFPPVNPFPFHQSRHFKAGHETAVSCWPPDSADTIIYSKTPLLHNRLLEDFERVRFERSGIVVGEYMAMSDGLILMDRKGNCFSINFPNDYSLMAGRPFTEVNTLQFWDHRQWLLDNWNLLPIVENGTIWSHIYHNNYYHFSFEFIQKARLTREYDIDKIVMPSEILRLLFQRDLLSRAIGGTTVILQDKPVRMINPVIADAVQSYEALGWLRRTVKFDTQPGKNRYYIRRTPKVNRPGNNLSESVEFLDFIERHNFTTIDFGSGEVPISGQIEMLREAAVILSPHGAGLTNISYLNPPLAIIEYFGRRVLSASFMQIAINLGFRYFAVIGEDEDTDKCIVPDVEQLEAIMAEIAG